MDEHLQEFVDSRAVTMRVDRDRGIIRGVKLLGLDSRNGRRYLPEALRSAASLYEGAKVNVNHPKGHPLAARDYEERLGLLRNVCWQTSEGLFGDLHFNPKHSLAEQLAWDAEHAPENVGLSHNVQARTRREGEQVLVEAILKVQSVDLVADPATTKGLFESRQTPIDLASATIEQLRTARPDLVEAVHASMQSELTALAEQLDELRAREAAGQRRNAALRLFQEYRLPSPDSTDALSRTIVSPLFLQTVLAAGSEQEMRRLVEERSALIHSIQWRTCDERSRPLAREQRSIEDTRLAEVDLNGFVKAITQA